METVPNTRGMCNICCAAIVVIGVVVLCTTTCRDSDHSFPCADDPFGAVSWEVIPVTDRQTRVRLPHHRTACRLTWGDVKRWFTSNVPTNASHLFCFNFFLLILLIFLIWFSLVVSLIQES